MAQDNNSTDTTDENLKLLRESLCKMFQLDRGDLDFGLYRVMNLKNEEITKFLDEDLLPQIESALSDVSDTQRIKLKEEMVKIEKQARSIGISDLETSSAYVEARDDYERAERVSVPATEIYKHLNTFFSRYYDGGDFMSMRRYKAEGKEAYLLPHNGEEVKLHWANSDQYYIKTTNDYQSYVFFLGNGADKKRIRFRVVSADNEQNNVKEANDKKRVYMLAENNAVCEEDNMLVVSFEHRPLNESETRLYPGTKNGVQQRAINEKAEIRIRQLAKEIDPAYELFMVALAPTEKDKERTILAKHLETYVAKNSFDYFIHKDLGGFLQRELEFYIKCEVLFLDDVEVDGEALRRAVAMIKAIKLVGNKIIDFLAQLENFQKQLWLKKKFVLQTDYCITLDRLPDSFYSEIVSNEKQIEDWISLFAINELNDFSLPLSESFIKNNPYLVLDTQYFSSEFKDKILQALSENAIANNSTLDEQTDGLLIHSENFQALNLLQTRYKEQIECIYIDPPYNTEKDRELGNFIFKDNYHSSSYMSMLFDRKLLSKGLLLKGGFDFTSISDDELYHLKFIIDKVFGNINFLTNIVRLSKSGGNKGTYVKPKKDYILYFCNEKEYIDSNKYGINIPDGEQNWETEVFNGSERKFVNGGIPYREKLESRRNQRYYIECPDGSLIIPKGNVFPQEKADAEMVEPKSHDDNCWTWSKDRYLKEKANNSFIFNKSEKSPYLDENGNKAKWVIYTKKFEWQFADRKEILPDVLKDFTNSLGTKEIDDFGLKFNYPKPSKLVGELINCASGIEGITLDYFAGSGTTGHAVINLNREDGGKRKYIMVEMGQYFDSVTKPRIQKIIYSKDWKDGKPVSCEGSSHCFKYMRLESYEDVLDSLYRGQSEGDMFAEAELKALKEDYLLRYALGVETADSANLLGDYFSKPNNYSLSVVRDASHCEVNADLAETFNYLLGLRIIGRWVIDGVIAITGSLPDGKKCLILWRDIEDYPNEQFKEWFSKNISRFEADIEIIYINGDHTLNALSDRETLWEAHTTEPIFRELMFKGAKDAIA